MRGLWICFLAGSFAVGAPLSSFAQATLIDLEAPAKLVAPSPGKSDQPQQPQRSTIDWATVDIKNVDVVPYLKDEGRKAYKEWTFTPINRAFAINPRTGGYGTSGDEKRKQYVVETALDFCPGGKAECFVYAINERVVWDGNTSQSVAGSAENSKAISGADPGLANKKAEEHIQPQQAQPQLPITDQNQASKDGAQSTPSPAAIPDGSAREPSLRMAKGQKTDVFLMIGFLALAGLLLVFLSEKSYRDEVKKSAEATRDRRTLYAGLGFMAGGVLLFAGYSLTDQAIRFASWVAGCSLNDESWSGGDYFRLWIKLMFFTAVGAPGFVVYYALLLKILLSNDDESVSETKSNVIGGFALLGAAGANRGEAVQGAIKGGFQGWFIYHGIRFLFWGFLFIAPFTLLKMLGAYLFCS